MERISEEQQINMPESSTGVFRVVLFKIENVKAYRAYCEKYGDEKGNGIIELMKRSVAENLLETEVMAMLDEDTIVTLIEKGTYKKKSERIITMFRNNVKRYYKEEDWKKGYISGNKKNGEYKKYPLIDICSERVI